MQPHRYRLIPLLYELRSLMDWIWTDTSMNLSDWFKMEDIFANIFMRKCERRDEEEHPTPRGTRLSSLTKYGLGGILLFVIILVIWSPLLLFSLASTVGHSQLPTECTMDISLGSYEPIFKITAQQGSLRQMEHDSWVRMQAKYKSNPMAQGFLATYGSSDVAVVSLNGNSTALWTVSPPSQEALLDDLNRTNVPFRVRWFFTRSVAKTNAEGSLGNERTVQLDMSVRKCLIKMLKGEEWNVTIPHILPRFLLVPREGAPTVVRALDTPGVQPFRNLTLRLRSGAFNNLSSRAEWWDIQERCTETYPYEFLKAPSGLCSNLNLVVFNDKVFPGLLSQVTRVGYGAFLLKEKFVERLNVENVHVSSSLSLYLPLEEKGAMQNCFTPL